MNWQNFSRGSILRKAVLAPEGDVCVVADSSNIESRILDWLAMQTDAMDVYRKADAKLGPDTYCVMAEKIYGRPINKKDNPDERQMGKVAKLGLGYGMGAEKFISPVRIMAKKKIDLPFSQLVVQAYRSGHPCVVKLWRRAESAIPAIASGQLNMAVDPRGVVVTCAGGLRLPNGLEIRYPDLKKDKDGWSYWNGRSREKIYGAKMVENIVQALARIVVMDQTLDINHYLPVAISVHDEAVGVTAADDGKDALEYSLGAMRKSPEWGPDLPLNSEGSFHRSYGEAK
jgi:DNA polymerase